MGEPAKKPEAAEAMQFFRAFRKFALEAVPPEQRGASGIEGRVPAHNLVAERATLSGCLLHRENIDLVIDLLREEHFFGDAHRLIWRAIVTICRAGGRVDVVTVGEWLRAHELLRTVGGIEYLSEVADATPNAANTERHAAMVMALWRVRAMTALGHQIVSQGYDVAEPEEWIDGIGAAVTNLATDTVSEPIESAHDIAIRVWQQISEGTDEGGVSTGLRDLDALLGPVLPGQMVVVAAHPGIGKTSLGLGIAVHLANGMQGSARPIPPADVNKHVTMFFSLEMERDELVQRAIFSVAMVNSSKRWSKRLFGDDWTRVTQAATAVARRNLLIDDRRGLTATQIRAKVRRAHAEAHRKGGKVLSVVIDYMQLVGGTPAAGRQYERREQELSDAAKALRDLGGELEIPIFVLAQLNSDADKRPDKRPRASDLRECKAIWMHADKVILIHNEHYAERSKQMRMGEKARGDMPAERCELIVDKNRGAATGSVPVLFWPSYTLFCNDEPEAAR